jgi:hypothetical protein
MALLGYKLTLRVQQHSSGVVNEIIAASTDVSLDITAEALETTSQTSGLNAEFIGGKVSGTVSGSYLLAADGEQWTNLFAHVNAGNVLEVEIYRDTVKFIDCDGVITSIGLSGGNSDSLVTGSYSIQLSGNPA